MVYTDAGEYQCGRGPGFPVARVKLIVTCECEVAITAGNEVIGHGVNLQKVIGKRSEPPDE